LHADVARNNIKRAGFDDKVDIRVGAAVDSLAQIAAEGHPPFDLVFIDADKPNNPNYLEWSLKLTRTGSLIIADNVARGGAVLDTNSSDESVRGIRRFNERVANEPRLDATAVQTVGNKGYDGFALIRVL
jgi:predicted O-methyltransferase YrrM